MPIIQDLFKRITGVFSPAREPSAKEAFSAWVTDGSKPGAFLVTDGRKEFFPTYQDAEKRMRAHCARVSAEGGDAHCVLYSVRIEKELRTRPSDAEDCFRRFINMPGDYISADLTMDVTAGRITESTVCDLHFMRLSSGQYSAIYTVDGKQYANEVNLSLQHGTPVVGVGYDEQAGVFRKFIPVPPGVWDEAVREVARARAMTADECAREIRENIATFIEEDSRGMLTFANFRATTAPQLPESSPERRALDARLRQDYPLGLSLYHALSADAVSDAKAAGGVISSPDGALPCTLGSFAVSSFSDGKGRVVELRLYPDRYAEIDPDPAVYLIGGEGNSPYDNLAGASTLKEGAVLIGGELNLFTSPELKEWDAEELLVRTGNVENFERLLEQLRQSPEQLRSYSWHEREYILRNGLMNAQAVTSGSFENYFLRDMEFLSGDLLNKLTVTDHGRVYLRATSEQLAHYDRYLSLLPTSDVAIERPRFSTLGRRFTEECARGYARRESVDIEKSVRRPMRECLDAIRPFVGGINWRTLPSSAALPKSEADAFVCEVLYAIYRNPELVRSIRPEFFSEHNLKDLTRSALTSGSVSAMALQMLSMRLYPTREARRDVIRQSADVEQTLSFFPRPEYNGLREFYPASFASRFTPEDSKAQFVKVTTASGFADVLQILYDRGMELPELDRFISMDAYAASLWPEDGERYVNLTTGGLSARTDLDADSLEEDDIIPVQVFADRMMGEWVKVTTPNEIQEVADRAGRLYGRTLQEPSAYPCLVHSSTLELLPELKESRVKALSFEAYREMLPELDDRHSRSIYSDDTRPFTESSIQDVMYRGDNRPMAMFHRDPAGMFFTPSREVAQSFGTNGLVYSAYLDIRNPKEVDFTGRPVAEAYEEARQARLEGYDSLICHNLYDGRVLSDQYCVFSPEQAACTGYSTYFDDIESIQGTARRLENIAFSDGVITFSSDVSINGSPVRLNFGMDTEGRFLNVSDGHRQDRTRMFLEVNPDALFGTGTLQRLLNGEVGFLDVDFSRPAYALPVEVTCGTPAEWKELSDYADRCAMEFVSEPSSYPAAVRLAYHSQENVPSVRSCGMEEWRSLALRSNSSPRERNLALSRVDPAAYRHGGYIAFPQPMLVALPDGTEERFSHFRLSQNRVLLANVSAGGEYEHKGFLAEDLDLSVIGAISSQSARLSSVLAVIDAATEHRREEGLPHPEYTPSMEVTEIVASPSGCLELEDNLRQDLLSAVPSVNDAIRSMRQRFGIPSADRDDVAALSLSARNWVARVNAHASDPELFRPVPPDIAAVCPALAESYRSGNQQEYASQVRNLYDSILACNYSGVYRYGGVMTSISDVLVGDRARHEFSRAAQKHTVPVKPGIYKSQKGFVTFRGGESATMSGSFAAYLHTYQPSVTLDDAAALDRWLDSLPKAIEGYHAGVTVSQSQDQGVLHFTVSDSATGQTRARMDIDALDFTPTGGTCRDVIEERLHAVCDSVMSLTPVIERKLCSIPRNYQVYVCDDRQMDTLHRAQIAWGLPLSYASSYPATVPVDASVKPSGNVIGMKDFTLFGIFSRISEHDAQTALSAISALPSSEGIITLTPPAKIFTENGLRTFDTVVFGQEPYLADSTRRTTQRLDLSWLTPTRMSGLMDSLEQSAGLWTDEVRDALRDGIGTDGGHYTVRRHPDSLFYLYDSEGRRASRTGVSLASLSGSFRDALSMTLRESSAQVPLEQVMLEKRLTFLSMDREVPVGPPSDGAFVTGVSMEKVSIDGSTEPLLSAYISTRSGAEYNVLLDSLPDSVRDDVRSRCFSSALTCANPGQGMYYRITEANCRYLKLPAPRTVNSQLVAQMKERGHSRMRFASPFNIELDGERFLFRSFAFEHTDHGAAVFLSGECLEGPGKSRKYEIQLSDMNYATFPAVFNEIAHSIEMYPVRDFSRITARGADLQVENAGEDDGENYRRKSAMSSLLASRFQAKGVTVATFAPALAVGDLHVSAITRMSDQIMLTVIADSGTSYEEELCMQSLPEVTAICSKCSEVFRDETLIRDAEEHQANAVLVGMVADAGGEMKLDMYGKEYSLTAEGENAILTCTDPSSPSEPVVLLGTDDYSIREVLECCSPQEHSSAGAQEPFFVRDKDPYILFRQEGDRYIYSFGADERRHTDYDLTDVCSRLVNECNVDFKAMRDPDMFMNFLFCRKAVLPTRTGGSVECSMNKVSSTYRLLLTSMSEKNGEGPINGNSR